MQHQGYSTILAKLLRILRDDLEYACDGTGRVSFASQLAVVHFQDIVTLRIVRKPRQDAEMVI